MVATSADKWHAYWLVDVFEKFEFTNLQKAIIQKFAGDKAVHDLPRVMRLPGFYHQKGEPERSELSRERGKLEGVGTRPQAPRLAATDSTRNGPSHGRYRCHVQTGFLPPGAVIVDTGYTSSPRGGSL